MKAILVVFGIGVASISMASAQSAAVPKDVKAFETPVDTCIHFSGETVENPTTTEEKKRAAEIKRKIGANCPGNTKRLAALKTKHKANAVAAKLLGEVETRLKDSGLTD